MIVVFGFTKISALQYLKYGNDSKGWVYQRVKKTKTNPYNGHGAFLNGQHDCDKFMTPI